MAQTSQLPAKSEERAMAISPMRPFLSLRREFDRMFDDFERGAWLSPLPHLFDQNALMGRAGFEALAPAVDVVEGKDAFEIKAELPGMDEKAVKIGVANGALSIKGEKHEHKDDRHDNYHVQERRYGAFERQFRLPASIDPDKIEATFKHGVLTVRLPKKPEAIVAEKKIEIKPAS